MCAPVSSLAGSLVVGRPHRLCFLPWSSRSTRGGSPPLCSCYVRLLEYTVSFGWRQRSQSSPALACRVRDTPLSRLPLRGPPPVTSRSFWLCPSLLLSSLCPPSECPGRGTARCHLSPPLAFAVQLPISGGSVGGRVWTPCFGSTRSVRSVAGVPSYCNVLVYLVPVQSF